MYAGGVSLNVRCSANNSLIKNSIASGILYNRAMFLVSVLAADCLDIVRDQLVGG